MAMPFKEIYESLKPKYVEINLWFLGHLSVVNLGPVCFKFFLL